MAKIRPPTRKPVKPTPVMQVVRRKAPRCRDSSFDAEVLFPLVVSATRNLVATLRRTCPLKGQPLPDMLRYNQTRYAEAQRAANDFRVLLDPEHHMDSTRPFVLGDLMKSSAYRHVQSAFNQTQGIWAFYAKRIHPLLTPEHKYPRDLLPALPELDPFDLDALEAAAEGLADQCQPNAERDARSAGDASEDAETFGTWGLREGGLVMFRGKTHELSGVPKKLLRYFLESTVAPSASVLATKLAIDEGEGLRSQIAHLRKTLRAIAADHGLDVSDPLPFEDRKWRFAMPRN